MIVTFVSQCEKNALKKTRRVLDSFANRIGDKTWQTIITMEGLKAVKKLLRKTASKSTAVSCHWIRSSRRVELMWVVGNRNRFNSEGVVPVHITSDDSLIFKSEYFWGNIEVIALLSSLAGIFHDIGKANNLFQNKLDPKKESKGYEPYRHEWVSLRLFQAFVANKSDRVWLKALVDVNRATEKEILNGLVRDGIDPNIKIFDTLAPIAKVVAWLIVAHHRLPIYPHRQESNPPKYEHIEDWLERDFNALWNSQNSKYREWTKKEIEDTWSFQEGTPFRSAYWQTEASELAKRALATEQLFEKEWFTQRFTIHLARLGLMIADHYYSPKKADTTLQDRNYGAWANTKHHLLNQKLDEHNIAIYKNAYRFIHDLPELREELPTLELSDEIVKPIYQSKEQKELFKWQDKAFKVAKELQKKRLEHGFFGINMASTGRGKTFANAKIMYALADEKMGCRFNIALGLRTLTLQTGDALAKLLKLKEEDYAVLIGSQAVKKLYDKKNKAESEELEQESSYGGSESSEALIEQEQTLYYRGIVNNRILNDWLEGNIKMQQIIDTPLLISTIDHLIPATEGIRGGKQIAPMLRLLTSDLVLDEPDDFALEDLPALCRLVNWTAMLGGKVLLSTATMPPALANALFRAYRAGWRDYTQVNGMGKAESKICCAWFDEFESNGLLIDEDFSKEHNQYIKRRIKNLNKKSIILRRATLLPICSEKNEIFSVVAKKFLEGVYQLHDNHHQQNHQGESVSIGLIRMANINPLVKVAQEILMITPREDTAIYYCIYHSKFPLAMRSSIEERLDRILRRDNAEKLWEHQEIKEMLAKSDKKHHIFVVLATSVAEVGRDHDYDWIIAEPSSMRSLIQLAGRIQRHRKQEPKSENFLILNQSIRALQGEEIAYGKQNQGFETKGGYGNNRRLLKSKDLTKILNIDDLKEINATPRIAFKGRLAKDRERKRGIYSDFAELEQWALFQRLLGLDGEQENASYWWESEPTWSAEIQRRQPFRSSRPDANYALCLKDGGEVWCRENTTVQPKIFQEVDEIRFVDVSIAEGNYIWFDMDTKKEYNRLSVIFNLSIKEVAQQFGLLRLDVYEDSSIEWKYNRFLGVFI